MKIEMSFNRERASAESGQGALVAIAITIMIALVLGGTAISSLTQSNSRRTVVTRQSLQTYYIAQAGIQEALATRMVPRSNTQQFVTGLPATVTPYQPSSGLVYQNPANQTGLIGVYRYLVVGGDPSRKADGTYYGVPAGPPFSVGPDTINNPNSPKPRLISFQSSPPDSAFYIISNGMTCENASGKAVPDKFTGAPTTNPKNITLTPSCQNGLTLRETSIVTKVNLEPEQPGLDKLNQTVTFGDHSAIKLPNNAKAFVPGSGWTNSVNFDNAWQESGTTNLPIRPTRIVFFDFATYKIYPPGIVDLTGSTTQTTVPGTIPAKASIMLYFDGPIDFRSLSTDYSANLTACKSSPNNCNMQLVDVAAGTKYSGMTIVPIMPYLTKVLLLAPIGGNLGTGKTYRLIVKQGQIRSFTNTAVANGKGDYTIEFTVN